MTPSTDPDWRLFPHPALASGNDSKSPQGIRMTDAGRRQPAPPGPLRWFKYDGSGFQEPGIGGRDSDFGRGPHGRRSSLVSPRFLLLCF